MPPCSLYYNDVVEGVFIMAIVKITTKDKNNRIYKKVFSNIETEGVICIDKKNDAFAIKPNFSIRKGESKFGDQAIMQNVIIKKLDNYTAVSPLDHSEVYFKLNNATLEFFEEIVNLLKEDLQNGSK